MTDELKRAIEELENEFLDPNDNDPLLNGHGKANLRLVISAARKVND